MYVHILKEKTKKERLKSRSLSNVVLLFAILIFSSAFLMTATIYMPQHQVVAQTSNVPFSQYNAQQYSIQYPTDSQVLEGERAGVVDFVTPPPPIFVHIYTMASNDTLNQATNAIIGGYSSHRLHFTLLEQKSISLANNTGFSILFSSVEGERNRDFVTKSVWTVSGGTAYVLFFSALPTYYYGSQTQLVIDQMINSFQINRGASPAG
jgi:hypothetical protein